MQAYVLTIIGKKLVQSLLISHISNITLKNWIWPVTPENWPNVKDKQIWAVGKVGKGKCVEKGDRIIFYVNKSDCFQGIFEVINDWHKPTMQWSGNVGNDRISASEINLKLIQAGYASVTKLAVQLEFIENDDYRTYIRGTKAGPANSSKPISDNDYELILEELKQVQKKPLKDVIEFIPINSCSFTESRVHSLPAPNLSSIKVIIEEIKNGRYAIPEFQRGYSWKRKQIEELWGSIFQGHFVGPILIWNSDEKFDKTPIHGASELKNAVDIILDGQQRMTSLFYAISPSKSALPDNEHMLFFINLQVLFDPNANSSDIVLSKFVNNISEHEYANKEKQFAQKIFPLTEFDDNNYKSWVRDFKDYLKEEEEYTDHDADYYYQRILNVLDQVWCKYLIPIVVLPKSVSLDSAMEIFEKINSKGTVLGIMDLLNTRFITHDIKIRELMKETMSSYNNIEKIGDTNINKHIIQGISLYKKGYIGRNELFTLDVEYEKDKTFQKQIFIDDWKQISEYTSEAITMLQSQSEHGFGAIDFPMIPHAFIITILSALLLIANKETDRSKCIAKIRIWYWSVVTSDSYSKATNSMIERDYKDMHKWFSDDNAIPSIVKEQRQKIDTLDITRATSSDSIYKTIMCLISRCGVNDFDTNERPKNNERTPHRIFPKSYNTNSKNNILINTILNSTLLNKNTSSSIRNDKPSIYLNAIIKKRSISESTLRKILQSHLISDDAFDCLIQDDFDGFIRARANTIRFKLKKLINPIELIESDSIDDLLRSGESKTLEFKSSMRWDMEQNRQSSTIEESIAKALCAFMNTDGGDLLIGVDDDRNLTGLKKDYSTFHGNKQDCFYQHLTNLIENYLGNSAMNYVDCNLTRSGEYEICHCKIRFASSPVYLKKNNKDEFYVRQNNTSKPLYGKDADEYKAYKWKKI